MDPLGNIRNQITAMERLNSVRRGEERRMAERPSQPSLASPDDSGLPALPPRLPRPEYSTTANAICQGRNTRRELEFYVACAQGLMPQVESYVQECSPTQAVRQYGLEQASFGNQPAVARYLLERGTILHDNVFLRSWKKPAKFTNGPQEVVTLFDKDRQVSIPLLEVFVEFGWHPNQQWTGFSHSENIPMKSPIIESLENVPLLTFLLSHGADPNLSHHNVGIGNDWPVDRRSTKAFSLAVRRGNPTVVALLVPHIADLSATQPLHELAVWQGPRCLPRPFSQRRPMAEYVLSSGLAGVNDIRNVTFCDTISQPRRREDLTPFALACAAQDHEYAEWLLEHGADPYLINGRAFEPMYWARMDKGPSDPQVVRDLVARFDNVARERQDSVKIEREDT